MLNFGSDCALALDKYMPPSFLAVSALWDPSKPVYLSCSQVKFDIEEAEISLSKLMIFDITWIGMRSA